MQIPASGSALGKPDLRQPPLAGNSPCIILGENNKDAGTGGRRILLFQPGETQLENFKKSMGNNFPLKYVNSFAPLYNPLGKPGLLGSDIPTCGTDCAPWG